MPRIIDVTIRDKIAVADSTVYVCGNSDYTIRFDLDAEWAAYDTKTARFVYGSRYIDVVFDGNECQVPIIANAYGLNVGVFAGNLHTTTPAYIRTERSILCGAGAPAAPSSDVYNEIMDKLNMISDDIGAAVEDYLEKNPIEGGVDFETDATLTLENGVLSVNTADVVEADNTLPVTSAAVNVTVGNINALLETI